MEQQSVHKILAQSYMTYLLLCMIGISLDILIPFRVPISHNTFLGSLFFVLGPLLIVWAQRTSFTFEKIKQKTGIPLFKRGPYKHFRNPTQIGLLFLVAGFVLVTGAIMLFLCTVIAYCISNVFFRKHEQILENRYGDEYRAYKQEVKKVL